LFGVGSPPSHEVSETHRAQRQTRGYECSSNIERDVRRSALLGRPRSSAWASDPALRTSTVDKKQIVENELNVPKS